MGLKDINTKVSYETSSESNQLLDEFYIPVLQQANRYYRIAGFFSSTSLIVAAQGIGGLINNGGKMYLLVSPELSEEDYRTIKESGKLSPSADMFSDLQFNVMPHENLKALAWLLDNNKLEIKIVVAKKSFNSLFHQKVGIVFDDERNIMSFSGSNNETAQAWINNIEEFKVFRSWEPGQVEYLQSDLKKFLSYWKNERTDIADVYDVPDAVREKIIEVKPRDIWDLNIMRRYCKDATIKESILSLFPHQENAVKAWMENKYRLLMEMATGTGKTRTAIGCMVEKLKESTKLCIIVATPQITLSRQWEADIKELNIPVDKMITVPGNFSSIKWKQELELALLDLYENKIKCAMILTTHVTSSSDSFINIVKKNKFNTDILFVCDEVHAIGSSQQRRAMLDEYQYRIGLSATPERMFDDTGTSLIREYFGNKSFEFTIADALNTINPRTNEPFLNRYSYHPIFVYLTSEETKQYSYYSRQIAILKQTDDYDPDELQRLYDRRAAIGKNAENKYVALDDLLEDMQPSKIQDTILFVSDKQIRRSFDILSSKKIKRAKITESESANKIVNDEGESERQQFITQFKNRQLQILVAIKCLDEGIDIKNARTVILMANSTNPREYIQRVGRVIRQVHGKPESLIYDFIIIPDNDTSGGFGILEKEARRANLIAINATNYSQVKHMFSERGVELDANQ